MNAPLKTKPKKAEFSWSDPLLLDSQLTEQERMVRDAARAFAQEKLQPRVLEAFRHEKADRARIGARRFRLPIHDERAELARHDADPRVRLRRAQEEVLAEAR